MDATNADLTLDGNAVAGVLIEVFGEDLTGVLGTCLLYTSPSPRDLSTSRMPSSA